MLQLRTEFPLPGSIALFEGLRWRIWQHAGADALIAREGPNAALTRRAPLDELVDPVVADHNALLPLTDISEATKRIALFTAKLLRDANDVGLYDLGQKLRQHADAGRIPLFTDNAHLARIMRTLGWRKDGWTGPQGQTRSPRYIRVATPAKVA